MSSLLQFRGKIDKDGVHVEVYKTIPGKKAIEFETNADDPNGKPEIFWGANWEETDVCSKCGKVHPRLWTFVRKPVGMWGCWVVFRYNGAEHVPDLSHPLGLDKLPRGSKKMTQSESEEAWHK